MSTATKTWTPTRYQQIYRHKSGTYYARTTLDGKKTWRSLQTSVLGIAKEKLEELTDKEIRRRELNPNEIASERMTGADVIAIRKHQLDITPTIKATTRKYWKAIILSLERTWPEFPKAELRKITDVHCQEWASEASALMSESQFNNSIGLLKALFEIAISKGVRRTNPASGLKRVKVKTKDLSTRLPSKEKFTEWITAIRESGSRFSRPCADYVEFLAYTGMRTGEARWVEWRHCDFARGEIVVEGDPEEGTKNRESRRVPMIPAVQSLLGRLKQYRKTDSPSERVLKVCEAQKSMDNAGKKVGMERITHHDLRHFFATVCIESGVDIPTVAKWLGHKDGGALAMKVYGHLRNEHSLAEAKRVSF